jgi:hypothetical protein
MALAGYLIAGIIVFLAALLVRFLVRRSSNGFLLWRALRDAGFYDQVLAAQILKIER